MRYIIPILLVAVVLLTGCPPGRGDHNWQDIHVGKLTHVSGFGSYLVVQFEEATYKVPYSGLTEGDPWTLGETVALQDKVRTESCPPPRPVIHSYRFRAIQFDDPSRPILPAEKEPATR